MPYLPRKKRLEKLKKFKAEFEKSKTENLKLKIKLANDNYYWFKKSYSGKHPAIVGGIQGDFSVPEVILVSHSLVNLL